MNSSHDPYAAICTTKRFAQWGDLAQYFEQMCPLWPGWIYRGDHDNEEGLKSSFEKAVIERALIPKHERIQVELGLLRRFKRQAHQFVAHLPGDSDHIEWLSLMQHHGAPTRLLDWTYSFHVALYFAVESVKPGKTAVIWVLDPDWIASAQKRLLPKATQDLLDGDPNVTRAATKKELFWLKEPIKFVHTVNSVALNVRQAIQQGVFLAPGDVREPFLDNLLATVAVGRTSAQHILRLVLDCTPDFLRDASLHLQRTNVNASTLFPGLDGFARNLTALLADHKRFLAIDPWDVAT